MSLFLLFRSISLVLKRAILIVFFFFLCSLEGDVDLSGEYSVFPGCVESVCCCPSSKLVLTKQGTDIVTESSWTCGETILGEIDDSAARLVVQNRNVTLSMSGNFLQAVHSERLACSFGALRVNGNNRLQE